ncbi:hypothetical protein K488DRAFT_68861 [Vararia minispora EC-137]|uniref:Uncharacterized protein n=1 Tax=Vararia minispora EC-137 TaxID=1314806 RepID=A0ACB8QSH9_9AGAM|nr:hypothetical protein K488DRAFT_68861 [Vararia minispora EC-137]
MTSPARMLGPTAVSHAAVAFATCPNPNFCIYPRPPLPVRAFDGGAALAHFGTLTRCLMYTLGIVHTTTRTDIPRLLGDGERTDTNMLPSRMAGTAPTRLADSFFVLPISPSMHALARFDPSKVPVVPLPSQSMMDPSVARMIDGGVCSQLTSSRGCRSTSGRMQIPTDEARLRSLALRFLLDMPRSLTSYEDGSFGGLSTGIMMRY